MINIRKNMEDWLPVGLMSIYLLALVLLRVSVGVSWFAVGLVDLYLLFVFWGAASKSGKANWFARMIPNRMIGLIIFLLLLLTSATGFAEIYLTWGEEICKGETSLTNWWDALYFSFATVTTVGYGDFVPITGFTKRIVMFEMLSGILLLAGGLGLLISRIADYQKLSKEIKERLFKESIKSIINKISNEKGDNSLHAHFETRTIQETHKDKLFQEVMTDIFKEVDDLDDYKKIKEEINRQIEKKIPKKEVKEITPPQGQAADSETNP